MMFAYDKYEHKLKTTSLIENQEDLEEVIWTNEVVYRLFQQLVMCYLELDINNTETIITIPEHWLISEWIIIEWTFQQYQYKHKNT